MNTPLSKFHGHRLRMATIALTFVVLGVMASAARCIENTSIRTDAQGFTHIYGEMFNDTDVQGVQMMLRGRLLDAQGNVVAEQVASICPPDSQPHGQSMFDIKFDRLNMLPYSSSDFSMGGGSTVPQPLPDPKINVVGGTLLARRFGKGAKTGAGLAFGVRNTSGKTYPPVQGCAAAYNDKGQVVAAVQAPLLALDQNDNEVPAVLHTDRADLVFLSFLNIPSEATFARAWLWVPGPTGGTSPYQHVMTQTTAILPCLPEFCQ
jgi:hypothetical protein